MAEDTATADAAEAEAEEAPAPTDPAREALVARLTEELGDAVLDSHIAVGSELWIRVPKEQWVPALRAARDILRCQWFDFLSAIDWMPSPFGRDMESEQDWIVHGRDERDIPEMQTGVAGGDTRFQVMARVYSVQDNHSVIFKTDLPADDLTIDTLLPLYPGANWHEREAWEMFGIHFNDHPDLRAIYLPTGFEGNPLRKDFPLLARRVKPWPGIVDVEPMPEVDAPAEDAAAEPTADETAGESA